jgi:hypothetical protein
MFVPFTETLAPLWFGVTLTVTSDVRVPLTEYGKDIAPAFEALNWITVPFTVTSLSVASLDGATTTGSSNTPPFTATLIIAEPSAPTTATLPLSTVTILVSLELQEIIGGTTPPTPVTVNAAVVSCKVSKGKLVIVVPFLIKDRLGV